MQSKMKYDKIKAQVLFRELTHEHADATLRVMADAPRLKENAPWFENMPTDQVRIWIAIMEPVIQPHIAKLVVDAGNATLLQKLHIIALYLFINEFFRKWFFRDDSQAVQEAMENGINRVFVANVLGLMLQRSNKSAGLLQYKDLDGSVNGAGGAANDLERSCVQLIANIASVYTMW